MIVRQTSSNCQLSPCRSHRVSCYYCNHQHYTILFVHSQLESASSAPTAPPLPRRRPVLSRRGLREAAWAYLASCTRG